MREEFNYYAHQPHEEESFLGVGSMALRPGMTILEAAAPDSSLMGDFSGSQTRSAAMALALAFVEGGDFSYAALEAGAFLMADADEDQDISDDEQDFLNELLQGVADAFTSLGADAGNVASFMDDEDDAAGATLGAFLSEKMSGTTMDDDEIIANYAVGGDMVLESIVKVVRSGKVVLKRKRIGRPKKITAIQRAGLKKARMRAFTGAAKVHRAKSMKIRKQRGM